MAMIDRFRELLDIFSLTQQGGNVMEQASKGLRGQMGYQPQFQRYKPIDQAEPTYGIQPPGGKEGIRFRPSPRNIGLPVSRPPEQFEPSTGIQYPDVGLTPPETYKPPYQFRPPQPNIGSPVYKPPTQFKPPFQIEDPDVRLNPPPSYKDRQRFKPSPQYRPGLGGKAGLF